jgi:hypothetical protein
MKKNNPAKKRFAVNEFQTKQLQNKVYIFEQQNFTTCILGKCIWETKLLKRNSLKFGSFSFSCIRKQFWKKKTKHCF